MKTSELRELLAAQQIVDEEDAAADGAITGEVLDEEDDEEGNDLLEALWLLKDAGEFLTNIVKYATLRPVHRLAANENRMAIYDFLSQFEEFSNDDDIDIGGEA